MREPRGGYEAPTTGDLEDSARQSVVGLMSLSPVSVDELVRQTGLSAALVQTALLELEIAGRLQRHAGGKVSIL
jgi:DNA processing protein